jgi:phage terminase small subunit
MTDEVKPLKHKQQVFIDEYLLSFNATDAAKRAGYSEKTAHAMGWENLRKPEIKAQIDARLSEVHMSADEAIKRLSDMARGDIGQFMDRLGSLDIQAARDAGITPLIKKIKQRTVTKIGKTDTDQDTETHDLEIELYSAQDALDKILKVHGRYTEHVDMTSNGETINPYLLISDDEFLQVAKRIVDASKPD